MEQFRMLSKRAVLLLCFFCRCQSYMIPPLEFDVKPHEFSAWIPDAPNVTYFAFNGRLNQELGRGEPGEFVGEIKNPEGGRWIYKNTGLDLKVGDTIYYWVFVQHGRFGYRLDGQNYQIRNFTNTGSCLDSTTIVDGNKVCAGTLIFEDDFAGATLNGSNWMIDHLIPANSKNYEFVSYQNNERVLRVSNNKLTIRPNAHTEEDDIRGLLDIRQGCTGSGNECLQQQFFYQILPPVVSARIHSRKKFRYARIEVKAKLPLGDWIYPQIRLTKAGEETEVWIAYARGNQVYKGNNQDDIGASLLFGGLVRSPEEPRRSELLRSFRNNGALWTDSFHNYTVHWKPSGLTFFVDGTQYGDISSSEYENSLNGEMSLTIGVGVGGINDFPDGYISTSGVGKPWINKDVKQIRRFFDAKDQWLPTWGTNAQLEVDYVKTYAL